MLLALLLIASVGNWTPARWSSADPETLPLLRETPINCVLMERDNWSAEFAKSA